MAGAVNAHELAPAETNATRRPDFLVIGAGRAGTTSLHQYLSQHPAVFLPARKAPSYWYAVARPHARDLPQGFVHTEAEYRALFSAARPDQLCGEVSPVYLAATDVAARVATQLPHVRIVAILRHPVDRVYARWVARRRDGLERTETFEALVARERSQPLVRTDAHATYLASGIVSPMLQSWFDVIPADRRLVLWFEDFARDTGGSLRQVCRFLGVRDDVDLGTSRRHNASGGRISNPVVRSLWASSFPLRRLVRPLVPAALRDGAFRLATRQVLPVPMSRDTREQLVALYTDEIRSLSALTGRDLSHWLQVDPAPEHSSA